MAYEIDYNGQPVVEMKNITKRFPGVIANENVSLTLHKGEVLALLGENGAGKSTLMNMLIGLYHQDEGDIYIEGRKVEINSPNDAMALGIGMIHQEFKLVGNLTVAENIILGMKDIPMIPNFKEIDAKIRDLSDKYQLKVDPDAVIQNLSVGEQQRVEILKLIYRGADILILDEPTAVLTPAESRDLNKIIQTMLSEGKSAIFISHKMDEVMEFSDRVQILRKGRSEAVKFTKDIKDIRELSNLMVGRDVMFQLEKGPYNPGEVLLRCENLTINDPNLPHPVIDHVNLEIHRGEILGIAGVAGNGQQQLTEAITGLLPTNEGKLEINGKDMTNHTPLQIIREGVSHIPADRGKMGTVGDMSVKENLSMKKFRTEELSHNGVIRKGLVNRFADKLIDIFTIKTPTAETEVKFLSGGNIQKTILAREIDSCQGILIAVYPSRGLDVGATESVRQNIIRERDNGVAVLLVSEELEELLTVADRIAVMFEGKIMDTLDATKTNTEELGLLMAGVKGGTHA